MVQGSRRKRSIHQPSHLNSRDRTPRMHDGYREVGLSLVVMLLWSLKLGIQPDPRQAAGRVGRPHYRVCSLRQKSSLLMECRVVQTRAIGDLFAGPCVRDEACIWMS
jgi:hypothetical protein